MDVEGTLDTESADRRESRLWNRVDSYEGIQLVAPDYRTAPSETFTLSYEGVLPQSESRTGMFELVLRKGWTLIDSNKNFCAVGVEAGDVVVLIDSFHRNPAFLSVPHLICVD